MPTMCPKSVQSNKRPVCCLSDRLVIGPGLLLLAAWDPALAAAGNSSDGCPARVKGKNMCVDRNRTACYDYFQIEVARFRSSFSDVAGTEEEKGKGKAPKEEGPGIRILGMM